MTASLDRRHFLRMGGALSGLGLAAPFALQLAAAGSAASQQASDYRALVCIFLFGGNDANNMILPTDTDSFGRYFAARNQGTDPIALMPVGTAPTAPGQVSPVTGRVSAMNTPESWGGVLPFTPRTNQPIPAGTNAAQRTFAMHPFMGPLRNVFDAGRLAVVANVGTLIQPITKTQYNARTVPFPNNLFSHNDQQSTRQANATEGARQGWGGRMGDMLASSNGANTLFTAISTAGNAVFLAGGSVVQYQLSTGAQPAVAISGLANASLFQSSAAPSRLRDLIMDTNVPSSFAADYATSTSRSLAATSTLNTAFAQPIVAGVPAPPAYTNPVTGLTEGNSLATQLHAVARMIASSSTLGLQRQVFFVSLGGWDTHSSQNETQGNLLAKVAHAMAYFDQTLGSLGGVDRRSQVTTFTASDFSRTYNTNSDGTDYAWGSHHLVMGGAVRGGDMYGQFPTVGRDGNGFLNPDMVGGALIPTTSVEQYAATMGTWMGVSNADLDAIFPNLRNFGVRNLGFV